MRIPLRIASGVFLFYELPKGKQDSVTVIPVVERRVGGLQPAAGFNPPKAKAD
jgi:hypothetical protein